VERNTILQVRRVGKVRQDMKRILRVNCGDERTVKTLLMRAKSLKTSYDFRTVYIGRDLTLQQQREERILREELERRRRSGQNVVIYRGKICDKSEIGKEFRGQQSFR